MHAAMAYINGAGARRIGKRRSDGTDLELLKTLLSTAVGESPIKRQKGKSRDARSSDERQFDKKSAYSET
jgi:hypothetical protein